MTLEATDKSSQENGKPKGNRVANIFIFIVLMIVAQLPMILAMTTMNMAVINGNLGVVIGLSIAFIILTALVIWGVRTYYHKRTYENVKQKIKGRDIGINILWFIGLRILIVIFSVLMMQIYGEAQSENDEALMKSLTKIEHLNAPIIIGLIIFFIAITFIAPYLEEHVFRGIFKETIFSKLTLWSPLLLSSAIFSINHASSNIIGFLMYMSMGAIFYLAYRRRGSIKDSMMVHILNNAIAGIVLIASVIFAIYS